MCPEMDGGAVPEKAVKADLVAAMLREAHNSEERGDEARALGIYQLLGTRRDEELERPQSGRRRWVIKAGEEADGGLRRIRARRARVQERERRAARAVAYVTEHGKREVEDEIKRAVDAGEAQSHARDELKWAVALCRAHLSLAPADPERMARLGAALRHLNRFPEASIWFDRALASATVEAREPRWSGEPSSAERCLEPVVTEAGADVLRSHDWIYTAQAALWSALGMNDPHRSPHTIDSVWWQAAERQYKAVEDAGGRSEHVAAGRAALLLNYVEKTTLRSHAERARPLIRGLQGDVHRNLRWRFDSLAKKHGFPTLW